MSAIDASWNGPLSSYYSREVKTWLRNNPGRVGRYTVAATLKTAVSAFDNTGIYPIIPSVFGEADFTANDCSAWHFA